MKNRYTITISGIEMNVISEESPEAVESLVGLVDRRMRDIAGASRTCSKIEVALLCSLDYCSEKIKPADALLFLCGLILLGYSNRKDIKT